MSLWSIFGRAEDPTINVHWEGDKSLVNHKKHAKALLKNLKTIRDRFANYAHQVVLMAEASDQLAECLTQFYGGSRNKRQKRRVEAFEDSNRGMLEHASAHYDAGAFEAKILDALDELYTDAERLGEEIDHTENAHYLLIEQKAKVDALLERKITQEEEFKDYKLLEKEAIEMAKRSTFYHQIRSGVDTTVKYLLASRFERMDRSLIELMESQFYFFKSGAGTYDYFRDEIGEYRQRVKRSERKMMDTVDIDLEDELHRNPELIDPFQRVGIDNINVNESYFSPQHAIHSGNKTETSSMSSFAAPSKSLAAGAIVFKVTVWTTPFGLTVDRRGEVTKVETHADMVGVKVGDKVIAINDRFIDPKKFRQIKGDMKLPYDITLRREDKMPSETSKTRRRSPSVVISQPPARTGSTGATRRLSYAESKRGEGLRRLVQYGHRGNSASAGASRDSSRESLHQLSVDHADSYASRLEQANLAACQQLREKEDEINHLRKMIEKSKTPPSKIRKPPLPPPSTAMSPPQLDGIVSPLSPSIPPLPPGIPSPPMGGEMPPPPLGIMPPPPGGLLPPLGSMAAPGKTRRMTAAERRRAKILEVVSELEVLPITDYKPSKKLMRFHWETLDLDPKTIKDTIWHDIGQLEPFDSEVDIDRKTFENLFHERLKSSRKRRGNNSGKDEGQGDEGGSGRGSSKSRRKREKVKPIALIESRRSYNVDITLSRFKQSHAELVEAVLAMDESRIGLEGVMRLISVFPTQDERKQVSSYTGNPSRLGSVEQFFLTMASIAGLRTRLRNFRFYLEFSQIVPKIEHALKSILRSCHKLLTSKRLQFIFRAMLFCGWYLNSGTAKAVTYGFTLSSLTRFKALKSTDRKSTLLHYVVNTVNSHFHLNKEEPLRNDGSMINSKGYLDELRTETRAACRVEMGWIESEIKHLFESLALLKVCIREAEKTAHPYPQKITKFCEYAEERYDAINDDFKKCHREFSIACAYFREREKPWEEFFSLWSGFFSEYHRVETEVANTIANRKRMERREEARRRDLKARAARRAGRRARAGERGVSASGKAKSNQGSRKRIGSRKGSGLKTSLSEDIGSRLLDEAFAAL